MRLLGCGSLTTAPAVHFLLIWRLVNSSASGQFSVQAQVPACSPWQLPQFSGTLWQWHRPAPQVAESCTRGAAALVHQHPASHVSGCLCEAGECLQRGLHSEPPTFSFRYLLFGGSGLRSSVVVPGSRPWGLGGFQGRRLRPGSGGGRKFYAPCPPRLPKTAETPALGPDRPAPRAPLGRHATTLALSCHRLWWLFWKYVIKNIIVHLVDTFICATTLLLNLIV